MSWSPDWLHPDQTHEKRPLFAPTRLEEDDVKNDENISFFRKRRHLSQQQSIY